MESTVVFVDDTHDIDGVDGVDDIDLDVDLDGVDGSDVDGVDILSGVDGCETTDSKY